MNEGTRPISDKDEVIAEYLINEGYAYDVVPITVVLSGSRAYGIEIETSDYDYLGLHLMDTNECLEHPDYRKPLQVIKMAYHEDLEPVGPGEKGGVIELDSFEIWKFIDLLKKGSTVAYDILFLPPIHLDNEAERILSLMRAGLTTRVGKAAKGHIVRWSKKKSNRKKTILTYYRQLQILHFLKEEEWEWNMDALIQYMDGAMELGTVNQILEEYRNPATRKSLLSEEQVFKATMDIEYLANEIDRATIFSRLPDRFPDEVMNQILEIVKKTRLQRI